MTTPTESVKTIFGNAILIELPAERAQYLDEACAGNESLREDVEQLLAAVSRAGDFLVGATAVSEPTDLIGRQIGPYKLLQKIGEGGMGVVYMAEQTEPVHRQVALKVIKPGMDSQHVIARFEAERQALAMMDHVNIARVFDAGTTNEGRPYFVMELVHGIPITKYCDDNQLTPRERLELFVPICHAIQHAHQKGIIHRDIKPSNVMVTHYDGRPVPKVIDFGVAKATEQKLTDRTLFTHYGTMVGTLEYMSPEQAEMSALGVDTRSDVYSLGVLLYELLTGSTPLSSTTLKQAGHQEIIRMLKENDPPKPSTRLSQSGAALATISARRRMEPAQLRKQVRGELDWIVMKALEKDRNRRYESSSDLAADVQRYLDDQAVEACPPSAVYRFRKFVRRHRTVVSSVVLLALALVLGTTVSLWQAIQATNARNVAEQAQHQEARQRSVAVEQRKKADIQKQQAEENFHLAMDAVDALLIQVAKNQLRDEPHMEQLRRDLLQQALQFYQRFLAIKDSDVNVRLNTAHAFRRVADIQLSLGNFPESLASFHQAIALTDSIVKEHPANSPARDALAECYLGLGQHSLKTGNFAGAQAAFSESIALWEQLTQQWRENLQYRDSLADTWNLLGVVQSRIGQTVKAAEAWNKCLELMRSVKTSEMNNADYLADLAGVLNNLALLTAQHGELKAAQEMLDEAIRHQQAALELDPTRVKNREYLRNQLENQALINLELGNLDKAVLALRSNVPVSEALAREFPHTPNYRWLLAGSYFNLALALSRSGDLEEAEQVQRRGLEVAEQLVTEAPNVPDYRFDLAGGYGNLAEMLKRWGRTDAAAEAIRRAIDVCRRLNDEFPNPEYQDKLVHYQLALGRYLHDLGHHDESGAAYRQALTIAKELVNAVPDNVSYLNSLGYAHFRNENLSDAVAVFQQLEKQGAVDARGGLVLAIALYKQGDLAEARAWYDAAVQRLTNRTIDREQDELRQQAAELLGIQIEMPPD